MVSVTGSITSSKIPGDPFFVPPTIHFNPVAEWVSDIGETALIISCM